MLPIALNLNYTHLKFNPIQHIIVASLHFRIAKQQDLSALTAIYNQAIQAQQTADTIPYTVETRLPWFEAHQQEKYPLYAVELQNKTIGYGTLSQYRGGRGSLKGVVEVSYYLDKDCQGQGIGTALLQFLLKAAADLGFQHAYALLLDSNTGSVRLLEKFGFSRWGHLPEIARFEDRICGQFIYGKPLID